MSGERGRALAVLLRAGAWGASALIAAGLVLHAVAPLAGAAVAKAGLLVLMATPALQIVAAMALFLREGDRRYALVSLGVLAIVIAASAWGIAH